jgi:tetratricopeptide (TPR) repeat protein
MTIQELYRMLQDGEVFIHRIPRAGKRCALAAGLFSLLVLLALPAGWAAGPAMDSAREKFEAGRYREAVSLFQAALAQKPEDSSLAFWLMRSYYELDMTDEAVSAAEQAARLEPANSEYHQWLGRAYGRKAEKTRSFSYARKTRVEFETAVSLNPANLSARRDLLEFYMSAPWLLGGGKDKAWRQAEAIAAIDPVEGCLARADYWHGLDKPESAAGEYAKVLELKPRRIDPYFEVAGYYESRKDAGPLEAAVEAAAKLNPDDCRLDYYRGVAGILARKRLAEADQYLKTYLAVAPPRRDFPSHASAHVWLGQLYEQRAELQLAAEQYKKALELDPGNKDANEGRRRTNQVR